MIRYQGLFSERERLIAAQNKVQEAIEAPVRFIIHSAIKTQSFNTLIHDEGWWVDVGNPTEINLLPENYDDIVRPDIFDITVNVREDEDEVDVIFSMHLIDTRDGETYLNHYPFVIPYDDYQLAVDSKISFEAYLTERRDNVMEAWTMAMEIEHEEEERTRIEEEERKRKEEEERKRQAAIDKERREREEREWQAQRAKERRERKKRLRNGETLEDDFDGFQVRIEELKHKYKWLMQAAHEEEDMGDSERARKFYDDADDAYAEISKLQMKSDMYQDIHYDRDGTTYRVMKKRSYDNGTFYYKSDWDIKYYNDDDDWVD